MAVDCSGLARTFRDYFARLGEGVEADETGGTGERRPVLVARAPGRVNLIGEHTDYSGGLVLPAAIDRDIAIAFRPRADGMARLYSVDYDELAEFCVDSSASIQRDPARPWSDYFRGVAAALRVSSGPWGYGVSLRGLDAVIAGDIPKGAGLSSSAALEVASAFALLSAAGAGAGNSDGAGGRHGVLGLDLDRPEVRRDIALVCQKAENDFVGVRCGIMDQMASALGRAGHAVSLNCRTLSHELVPMFPEEAGVVLVVYDTGIRRGLGESEYNLRRAQVEQGAQLIAAALRDMRVGDLTPRGATPRDPGVRALGDLSPAEFEEVFRRAALPASIARRCEHVVKENERVAGAVAALRVHDPAAFGALMYESHESLRDLYEVSCPELDAAVDIARATPGVFGARMTGAGFGGCTINLVRREAVDSLQSRLSRLAGAGDGREDERERRRARPAGAFASAAFVVKAADGAGIVRVG